MTITLVAAAAASATLAACGLNSTTPHTSSTAGPSERLVLLNHLDGRVSRVAWRLLEANDSLCPVVRQSAGWALHSAGQYSREMRPFAERQFGLEGDLPGVLSVPGGSPAASAALEPGDLIISVNGEALAIGESNEAAQFEGLAANIARLDNALARGPIDLIVRRHGQSFLTRLRPVRACGYEVQLNPSDELNARADGRRLFISTALASFARNDDELAVILGHELAHHVLRHRHWSDAGGSARQVNEAAWAADGGEGGAEQQADRVGLYLMARAGFDPAVAAPFWRRFGESNWRVRFPQIGHASAGSRALALEQVQREIEVKRRAGGELLP